MEKEEDQEMERQQEKVEDNKPDKEQKQEMEKQQGKVEDKNTEKEQDHNQANEQVKEPEGDQELSRPEELKISRLKLEEELEPIWVERAEKILGEKREERKVLLEEFKVLVAAEAGLVVPQEEGFFLMYLRAGQMSPAQGLQVLRNHFTMRRDCPHYFQSSRDLGDLVARVFSLKIHCMLPTRDGQGRRVYVFRPGRWNPDKVPFVDVFCAGYMLAELVAREEKTQIAGLVALVDASGFGFKHLRAIGLEDGKNMASFFNISFPCWLRMSHVLNAPRMFHVLFNMLHPFLSEEVRDNVMFHSGDLATVRQHFPPNVLPSDMGGSAAVGPMDNAHNVEGLREMGDFFKERLTQYGYK